MLACMHCRPLTDISFVKVPGLLCCRYEDKFFEGLSERLDEVIRMRETHAELLELLVNVSVDHAVSIINSTYSMSSLMTWPALCWAQTIFTHMHCVHRLHLTCSSPSWEWNLFTLATTLSQPGLLPRLHMRRG